MWIDDRKLYGCGIECYQVGGRKLPIDCLREFVGSISIACAGIAILECLCCEDDFQNGAKLVLGTYAALAVIRTATEALQMLI